MHVNLSRPATRTHTNTLAHMQRQMRKAIESSNQPQWRWHSHFYMAKESFRVYVIRSNWFDARTNYDRQDIKIHTKWGTRKKRVEQNKLRHICCTMKAFVFFLLPVLGSFCLDICNFLEYPTKSSSRLCEGRWAWPRDTRKIPLSYDLLPAYRPNTNLYKLAKLYRIRESEI